MEHVSNSPALNSRGKAQNARVRPMQKRQGPLDFALLITVVIICAFGLVMVFSASRAGTWTTVFITLKTKACILR